MRRLLIVTSIALVAIFVSVNLSMAAGEVTNSDIATGAVNSRTIRDGGILNTDLRTGSVNTRVLRDRGIAGIDLASSAFGAVQGSTIASGVTVRGVVGGDFEGFTATAGGPCEDNCDWGVDASLPFAAPVGLTDATVLVDTALCLSDCPGISADSSESSSAATCLGSATNPTAPAGKVCIYVAGAANAVELAGYSVMPGTGASKYGFKLKWVSTTADDSFVDAVWAYTAP
ncbi:MAG: hypothetical protein WAT66_03825 [Actinomycetota bacterium]